MISAKAQPDLQAYSPGPPETKRLIARLNNSDKPYESSVAYICISCNLRYKLRLCQAIFESPVDLGVMIARRLALNNM